MRSIWDTKTAKSASVAGIAGLIMLIGPQVTGIAKRHYPKNAADIEDFSSIALSIAGLFATGGAFGAVLGRAGAKDPVVSPSWMPGPNLPTQ